MNLRRSHLVASGAATLAIIAAVILLSANAWYSRRLDEGVMAAKVGDGPLAIAKLSGFARVGSPTAQYALGLVYAKGFGVPANPDFAEYWLLKADKSRHHPPGYSAYYVARDYERGDGVQQDQVLADEWFKRARRLGYGSQALR